MPPKKSKDTASAAAATNESGTDSGGGQGEKDKAFRSNDLQKTLLFTYMKGHYKVLYGNLDPNHDSHTKRQAQKSVLKYANEYDECQCLKIIKNVS